MQDIYLSLGGNSGNTFDNLQKATQLLYERVGHILSISPVYTTAAWGFEGPDFLNAVVHVQTRLESTVVLQEILDIERLLGRDRNTATSGYQNRIIDIDLLFYKDEIIDEPDLQVPHPQLHRRKFVLIPLGDIAPAHIHPVFNKSIKQLLLETTDETACQLYSDELKNPVEAYNLQQYQYICLEGTIGAGKTSLATMIADEFNAKLVLERFKENPFLPKFYADKDRYAFPLEMSFLADRYQQLLEDIGQFDLFKNFMIADYDSYKSLIFARITLNEEEFALYKKLHTIMYKDIVKPGLYVYLYQDTERLLENIKKRGRDFEKDISKDYLQKINKGYLDFIRTKKHDNVRIVDISSLDFVEKRADYLKVLREISMDKRTRK